MKQDKNLSDWIQAQAKKLKGPGMIYVMRPGGIGCGIDEALQVYKSAPMPKRSVTQAHGDRINLKAPLRAGGYGVFMTIWKA